MFAIGGNTFGVVSIGMNAAGSFLAIGLNAAAPISLGLVNSVGLLSWCGVNAFTAFGFGMVNTIGDARIGLVIAAGIAIWAGITLVRRWSPAVPRPTVELGAIGDDGEHWVRARVTVDGDAVELRDPTATVRARAADGVAIEDGDWLVRVQATTAPMAGEHGYRDAIAERQLELVELDEPPRGRLAISPMEWAHGVGPCVAAAATIIAYLVV